jgi:transcriptional regulator with AAA-type ATPase domain
MSKQRFGLILAALLLLVESTGGGTVLLRDSSGLASRLAWKMRVAISPDHPSRLDARPGQAVDVRWVLAAVSWEGSELVRALPRAVRISVPPLRQRPEDIELLIERMLESQGRDRALYVSTEALEMLEEYEFPGNIRELESMIERACMLADGAVLLPEHFAVQHERV